MDKCVVIFATGGTIAGTSNAVGAPGGLTGYTAGTLRAEDLIAAVPALTGVALEAQTLAQLDSCDMDHATWQRLGSRVRAALARADVCGVVITHGTDILEETALFLHLTVSATKPVVLTAAMRPATAPSPDGPQNLLDAVRLAGASGPDGMAGADGARGVLFAFGGHLHAGCEVRKLHGYRVDAFSSGDSGPLAVFEDGVLRRFRAWPERSAADEGLERVLDIDPAHWPVVDVLTSHAGAREAVVDALVAAGARGLVIAGTGNGSVHHELLAAARRAEAAGVRVWRASRCIGGGVVGAPPGQLISAGALTPAQARVRLMLEIALETAAVGQGH